MLVLVNGINLNTCGYTVVQIKLKFKTNLASNRMVKIIFCTTQNNY